MPREPRLWQFRVRDILDTIGRIDAYVGDMTFEQFAADRRTLDAIERNFISIGEAARAIPEDIIQQFHELPWGDMRAMRNFVVHVYWGVRRSAARLGHHPRQSSAAVTPVGEAAR
jgi:uncharacterized protein with HEPN domain